MIDFIRELFGLAKSSSGIIKDVRDEKTKARGVKNSVLAEVEFNMDLILDHYLDKNVAEEKIIEKLRSEQLTKAMDEGFDFSKIKSGKITAEMTGENPFLKKYISYDCETLLRKIHHHIGQIKLLPELYNLSEDNKKINVKTRLENLGKRYILFSKFLTSK
ncbi:MAG: hypothetical protein ABIQ74_05620 [Chitinophagales bacterium]